MASTDLAVRIATIFDSSGLKKADKSIGGFEKQLKKLGGALAGAFAADKVIAFGKASVKAFAEDEKSAALLANTMKNLGIAFAVPQTETFISQLSESAAVADDVLRPAMQKLISTTGSLVKSQEMLSQAIEISRGAGVELDTVVQDLANAYVGNTKGLKKYNLGLTQAELKTADFAEVQKKLNNQFKGSNAAYLKTYAGQMEVLKTAAGEAQETIGKGLVDALSALAGSTSVEDLANDMKGLSIYIADVIRGVGNLGKAFKLNGITTDANGNFDPTALIQAIPILGSYINMLRDSGSTRQSTGFSFFGSPMESTQKARDAEAARQAELDAARRAKELLKSTRANTAELKKQAAQKKQAALFDLEKIGLVAALQGKISEEERLRLNLQLALLTGNDDLATKLSKQLADSISSTGKLAKDLTTLPDAKNPFAAWSAFLDEIIAKAKLAAAFGATGGSSQRDLVGLTPTVQSLVTGAVTGGAGSTSSGDVYITVNGSVLSEQDLVSAVQNGLNYNSLAGKRSDIGRIAGMFG